MTALADQMLLCNPIARTGDILTMSFSSSKRRIETDVMKLLLSNYDVSLVNDNMQEFHVTFHGPPSTPYEGGVWRIHVELPDQYPYKSPSIGFTSKIIHPNIDENSGSVCLDVINQAWSPMFDMINIFDVFLPQLLTYPNPSDPLNSRASSLMNRDHDAYVKHVRSMVQKYASPNAIEADGDLSDIESELSSLEPSEDDD